MDNDFPKKPHGPSRTDWTPNGVWATYLDHFNVIEQGRRDFQRSANEFLTALGKRIETALKFREITLDKGEGRPKKAVDRRGGGGGSGSMCFAYRGGTGKAANSLPDSV